MLKTGWKPGEPLPTRLPLFKAGDNPTAKGTFRVTEATLTNLAAYQRRIGRERVALDFEHNTVPGSREYARTREPREVAAFGTVTVLDGAIVLDGIKWTSLGMEKAEHYEDLSPVVRHTADGEVRGIEAVALVRCGATYGLSLLSADDYDSLQDKDNTMTPEQIAAAIQAAIDAAVTPLRTQLSAVETAIGAAPKSDVLTALSAQVATLERNDASREKDFLIRCAMLDGKNVALLKPETVTALSAEDLRKQLDALKPGEIPLEKRTILGAPDKDGAGKPPEPTEQQRNLAARLGLDATKVAWKR